MPAGASSTTPKSTKQTEPTTAGPKVPFSVEESKAQRLARHQSRFRTRGGCALSFHPPASIGSVLISYFCDLDSAIIPSGPNTLIDILLSKDINGLSPTKRRASLGQRKSKGRASISAKAAVSAAKKSQAKATPKKVSTKTVTPKKNSEKVGKARTKARAQDEEEDEVVEVKKPKPRAKRKSAAIVEEEDDDVVEVKKPKVTRRKSVAAPKKATGRAKARAGLPPPESGMFIPSINMYDLSEY